MKTSKDAGTMQKDDLAALLTGGAPGGKPKKRAVRWGVGAVLVVVLLFAGSAMMRSRANSALPSYQTEPVTRGTLSVEVTATGNLQPTIKVDVGSELSGVVEAVMVEENDHVKKGQELLRLDTSKLQDSIAEAEANLNSARAGEATALATLKEATANLNRLREVARLSGGKVPSKTEMETAEATEAKAQASVQSARASVSQAQATLNTDKINMSKATIKSPIDGVILTRSVEPGQTVAASFQVSTLFTIAQDLREMELEVAVDEADVGSVKDGQSATFTVDAYPGRKYNATVIRVAYGSTTSSNVVSYTTTLMVKNDDQSLRPGMTATAEIATTSHKNVLLVPNAALRFTPEGTTYRSRGVLGSIMPGPPREAEKKVKMESGAKQLWVLHNGRPTPVMVSVGQTDGRHTEITSGDVREGMQAITDSSSASK
jgi:HlyD family secretion protein